MAFLLLFQFVTDRTYSSTRVWNPPVGHALEVEGHRARIHHFGHARVLHHLGDAYSAIAASLSFRCLPQLEDVDDLES